MTVKIAVLFYGPLYGIPILTKYAALHCSLKYGAPFCGPLHKVAFQILIHLFLYHSYKGKILSYLIIIAKTEKTN